MSVSAGIENGPEDRGLSSDRGKSLTASFRRGAGDCAIPEVVPSTRSASSRLFMNPPSGKTTRIRKAVHEKVFGYSLIRRGFFDMLNQQNFHSCFRRFQP